MRSVVLGGAGAVGTLFSDLLAQSGLVTVVDVAASAVAGVEHVRCDVRALDSTAREAIAQCDLVMLALPERTILEALSVVLPIVGPEALFIETASVKSEIVTAVRAAGSASELLGINPMFAPSLGFAGQALVAIELSARERSKSFLRLVEEQGCRIARVASAEDHDRAMAAMQALTHATILSFATALKELGVPIDTILEVAPPPHRTLLAMLARILAAAPEVYWDVQHGNPFASAARGALARGMRHVNTATEAPSPSEFFDLLQSLSSFLGTHQDALAQRCAELFAVHARV